VNFAGVQPQRRPDSAPLNSNQIGHHQHYRAMAKPCTPNLTPSNTLSLNGLKGATFMKRLVIASLSLIAFSNASYADDQKPTDKPGMPGMNMMDKNGMPMPGMNMNEMHNMPMKGTGMMVMDATGDQGPSSRAFNEANMKMHQAMSISFTGDADVDFVKGMIPHHQGAIDMAKIVLQYGKDPDTKKLAEDIIKAQEGEIAMMQDWLAKHGK
jgi:uncharacterized protein (DUF305 family)